MTPRVPVSALLLLLVVGCKPKTVAPAADAGVPPAIEQPETIEPPAPQPEPQFTGAPIAVTEPELLYDGEGFVVQSQRWKLDGTNGMAWIVMMPRTSDVQVAAAEDVVPFVDLLPVDDGPWAAINGGFYEAVPNGPDHQAMGLVITHGVTQSKLTRRGGSGVLFVDEEGPHIVHRDAFRATDAKFALQSIDRIVDAGKSLVTRRPDEDGAMRSAVALADEHVWLVVTAADADIEETPHGVQLIRSDDGMPLWAFATYLADVVGASEALNLDGGISTQLVARDGDFELRIHGVQGTINAVVVRPLRQAQ